MLGSTIHVQCHVLGVYSTVDLVHATVLYCQKKVQYSHVQCCFSTRKTRHVATCTRLCDQGASREVVYDSLAVIDRDREWIRYRITFVLTVYYSMAFIRCVFLFSPLNHALHVPVCVSVDPVGFLIFHCNCGIF